MVDSVLVITAGMDTEILPAKPWLTDTEQSS